MLRLPDGKLDLRVAFVFGKWRDPTGMLLEWWYTDEWFQVDTRDMQHVEPAWYMVNRWTIKSTYDRSRGDRRRGEEPMLQDVQVTDIRAYFIKSNQPAHTPWHAPARPQIAQLVAHLRVPHLRSRSDRELDFRTVFAADEKEGWIAQMEVRSLTSSNLCIVS